MDEEEAKKFIVTEVEKFLWQWSGI